MKRQLQGILYYLTTDVRFSLTIFWAILGGLLLLGLLVYFIIGGENATFAFNFSFPIYVYAGIVGYITVKGVLPYLIRVGANRINLFIGVVIYFVGLAILNAVIANVLYSTATTILGPDNGAMFVVTSDDSTFYLHHLADILENNGWSSRIIIDASISFFLLIVFFIIGLIFYRYGLIGGFSFVGILIFMFIFGLANGWLVDFFVNIFSDFSIVFFYQLTLVGFIVYLSSFFLLRRLTI